MAELNSKKILKNTIVLYIRMVVTMLIALYTSRVILAALGIEDYGLYNVVGGVVGLFSFLKTSMTSATQRFLSYELGKEPEVSETGRVFCASMTAHIIISIIIFILCETIGLWFLNAQINIPEGREMAANYVYQFTVVSICFYMLNIPYNASVIAHEDMSIFAYISILDSIAKLAIAYAILYTVQVDKLAFYGFLMMFIAIANQILYWAICKRKYAECVYMFRRDILMIRKIFSFSGWTLLGQMAVVASTQFASILVNIFHSVVANAAIGIAQQVNFAVTGLVANFQTAYQPQITKSYAAGEYDYLNRLMYQASKVSYFLMFVFFVPIIFYISDLLGIWLGKVPQDADQFCIYFLIASLMNAIGGPLWMSVFATGNIRNYQIATTVFYLMDIVFVYVLFKLGFPPITAAVVKAIINFLVIFVRMFYCGKAISFFSAYEYLRRVIIPIAISSLFSLLVGWTTYPISQNIWFKIGNAIFLFIISSLSAYLIGLNKDERYAVKNLAVKFVRKR